MGLCECGKSVCIWFGFGVVKCCNFLFAVNWLQFFLKRFSFFCCYISKKEFVDFKPKKLEKKHKYIKSSVMAKVEEGGILQHWHYTQQFK